MNLFDVRPGEAVVMSETEQLVTTRSYVDAVGRLILIGLLPGVPTIITSQLGGLEAAEEIIRGYQGVSLAPGAMRGAIPVTIPSYENSAKARFLHKDPVPV